MKVQANVYIHRHGCPGFELIPTVAGGHAGLLPDGGYVVPATEAPVMRFLGSGLSVALLPLQVAERELASADEA